MLGLLLLVTSVFRTAPPANRAQGLPVGGQPPQNGANVTASQLLGGNWKTSDIAPSSSRQVKFRSVFHMTPNGSGEDLVCQVTSYSVHNFNTNIIANNDLPSISLWMLHDATHESVPELIMAECYMTSLTSH